MVVAVVLLEQDVRRLDVAVDEPTLVCLVERSRDLGDDRRGARRIERAFARDELAQVLAVHVAHRQIQGALVLAGLVDRDDVRVVERGGDPRLALEASAETWVLGQLGRDELERDVAVELLLVGEVDDAHAATADQPLDLASCDLRARAGLVPDAHRSWTPSTHSVAVD